MKRETIKLGHAVLDQSKGGWVKSPHAYGPDVLCLELATPKPSEIDLPDLAMAAVS